jgi:fumarate reductase (CoM/CoB) subunit A
MIGEAKVETMTPMLEVKEVSKYFGGLGAVKGVTLTVQKDELLSIIGPNGSGKTTLFNLITGVYEASKGIIRFEGERIHNQNPNRIAEKGIARTFQNIKLFHTLSVLGNVLVASYCHGYPKPWAHVFGLPRGVRREKELRQKSSSKNLSWGGVGGSMKPGAQPLATVSADVLIIGGGGAGCQAAIFARKAGAGSICLVEKGIIGASGCTVMGTYSCCAALGHSDPRDNPQVHFEDTYSGGAEIGDPELVRIFTEEAPARVWELAEGGVPFEREGSKLKQGRMFGHTYPRACYVGMRTGQAMQWGLRRMIQRTPGVQRCQDIQIYRLLVQDGKVFGARGLNRRTLAPIQFLAKSTVVATGGAGQLYAHTTTSLDNTGDGLAIALEAGAPLQDMEFVQFYPVSSIHPRPAGMNRTMPTFLAFVPGSRMYNQLGQDFVDSQYPGWRQSLARDLLSQLIYREVMEGRGTPRGGVYLDVRSADPGEVERALSVGGYYEKIQRTGIDVRETAWEVGPASHFLMRGIQIGAKGQTKLPGLFACGEAAAGVHGANRLGGNALSEILVTGARAGEEAARLAAGEKGSIPPFPSDAEWEEWIENLLESPRAGLPPGNLKKDLQGSMWKGCGVIRTGEGLRKGLQTLDGLETALEREVSPSHGPTPYHMELQEAIETRLMLRVARCILTAAQRREESRGAQYRDDFPASREEWRVNSVLTRAGNEIVWEKRGR